MGWTLLLLLLKSDPASFKMKQDKHTQKRGEQNRGIENAPFVSGADSYLQLFCWRNTSTAYLLIRDLTNLCQQQAI